MGGIQNRPRRPFRAAKSMDGGVSITCHRGGCGVCNGFGSTHKAVMWPVSGSVFSDRGGLMEWVKVSPGWGKVKYSPSNEKNSSVQHLRITSRVSAKSARFTSGLRTSAVGFMFTVSRGYTPRPMPISSRPPLRWSSMARSSASWIGWRKVMMLAAWPTRIRSVWAARSAHMSTGLGHTSSPSCPKWCSVVQIECQPVRSQYPAIWRPSATTCWKGFRRPRLFWFRK